ncbi:zinc finger BED domain-containing protein RICESLEEPER 1-like [Hevea brasiliensis]|uniref:zinc finger BED domain-containing protein RICESLEEPER 1-like n=1 Tax=Hevea brasiliensis TaxID=3981 RepID=UPI0025F480D8|nr:zinc finger BED domain-containing protein RICESLEEPER 1-like [Hevea brasiliensis]
MDDATENVDEANQNKEKDVIEANEEEENPFASKKRNHATVRKDYFSAYDIEKKKVKDLLKHIDKVSVTTDLWKSGQQVSYMVITAHFMDSNWNLQKCTLNFCDVPSPHTGVVICDVLMLKDNLAYKNSLALNGKLFHVKCCAHILKLLVQDGLSEIEDIIFNDVSSLYQQRDPTYTFLPSEEDCEKVKEVCSFLEEFNKVTKVISSTEYPTSNLFLAELYNIKKLLNEAHENVGYMQAMVSKMKKKFDKFLGDCNLLISIAAVLDPRNKMKLVEWCFPEIYSTSDAIEQMTIVQETLRMLYNEYFEAHRAKNVDTKISGAENQREGSSCIVSGKRKVRGRAQFYSYIRNVDNIIEQVKSKLEVCLEDGCHICEDDEKFDALEWWKMNNMKYRVL